MIRAGVVGYGYWGAQVVRNLRSCGAFEVAAVCDLDPARREQALREMPDVVVLRDPADLLRDPTLDCVAVVTPAQSHFELALAAIAAGKHVWVEKPITASSEQARRLVDAADRRGALVFVDHTFIYTGAVRKLRELVVAGDLGALRSYTSERTNLGLFRADVGVLWDLAAHDVSILNYVFAPRVLAASATGAAHVAGMPDSTAFMTLFLDGGAIGHVHVDWLAPAKLRRVVAVGTRRMIVYDDSEPRDKLRLHDLGVEVAAAETGRPPSLEYRRGAVTAPALDDTEALRAAALHFAGCIREGTRPLTDGLFGLQVVRVLEAACASLARRGEPVELGGP